jgi:sugar phosphate isomerase/epimerase
MSVSQWAELAKKVGFDGIDISIRFLDTGSEEEISQIKKNIKDASIELVMVTTYSELTTPYGRRRQSEIEKSLREIDVASRLGAKYVRATSGQNYPGLDKQDGIKWTVEGLRLLKEHADEVGVQLVYENHGRASHWNCYDFNYDFENFLEICRRTEDISLAINWDTANAYVAATNPTDAMEEILTRIVTVHVSDTQKKGEPVPTLIGEGEVPIREMLGKLKANRYDGWLCIEEASKRGRAGLEHAIMRVRSIWRSI